ncbi:membrane protein [Clostridium lundense]|uniref:membrane protein n=1 Tax=Clostridium lundense TaxID=319475 RepID=UPI000485F1EC|nr:membrane protein [Clostridium lundense]
MAIQLGSLHYIYLLLILIIFIFMILKKDITVLCILGIFILGFTATGSIPTAIAGIFNSFILAINELLGTILIISVITAMGVILNKTGINEAIVKPFTKLMKTPALAYWIIGIFMMIISLFFWPSPAVALIGAMLVPAAVKAGLPAIGAAVAMNLFGHGIALSGDFIIQGAPKLTADGAGIAVGEVVSASIPLVAVMGIVTTLIAFIMIKKDMKAGKLSLENKDLKLEDENIHEFKDLLSDKVKKIFALVITIMFILDIYLMSKLNLQGGDATALIGGTALVILVFITIYIKKKEASSLIISYIVEGFIFGFKVFGPVIPIAAFFYLGDSGFIKVFGEVLPKGSTGLVNDLGLALANAVPINAPISATTLTAVGIITGLDGSGFSGISLAGSVAKIFGIALQRGTATLTALGQLAAIWIGGGTLIPWALIPVAAICKVDPFELARRNLKPVAIGLIVTTIFAMFLI